MSVTVNSSDSVTWRNAGSDPYVVTANNGSFDTGTLNSGQSKTIVFRTVGAFDYHRAIHASMRGTVTVLAAAATAQGSERRHGSRGGPRPDRR